MFNRTALFVPVLLACAYGQGTTATAIITRNYSFPPTGLSSSETAQVNVMNTAPASSTAASSCAGTITFGNAAGTEIGSAVPFNVTGAQIFSTQLAFSKLGMTANRGEFAVALQVTTSIPATTPCSLVFSLETFDNSTGATHIFLGNSAASLVPVTGPIGPIIPFAAGR
jgi:hypothetical protein